MTFSAISGRARASSSIAVRRPVTESFKWRKQPMHSKGIDLREGRFQLRCCRRDKSRERGRRIVRGLRPRPSSARGNPRGPGGRCVCARRSARTGRSIHACGGGRQQSQRPAIAIPWRPRVTESAYRAGEKQGTIRPGRSRSPAASRDRPRLGPRSSPVPRARQAPTAACRGRPPHAGELEWLDLPASLTSMDVGNSRLRERLSDRFATAGRARAGRTRIAWRHRSEHFNPGCSLPSMSRERAGAPGLYSSLNHVSISSCLQQSRSSFWAVRRSRYSLHQKTLCRGSPPAIGMPE